MRNIKSKSVIFFFSTLLIAISLFFTSCDNFMNAGDIRKEIEDTIAYNNAQSCDVSFKMDSEKMGEFLGTTQKTLHKGYEVEVQFEINILEYHFETLEAVSYTDKSVSRKDCVKFTELERNDTKGKYKYKIELLEKADDILIRPVCKELPKIFEFAPLPSNTTYPQDTSIKFTFTKPVNKESFTPADCISIYADDDLNSYFNFAEPVFSNDNKTLYIHTKPDVHILAPNGDKTIQTIHVSYDFSTVKDTDEMPVGIQGSFDYKINTSFTGEQKVSVWLPDNTQLGTVGSFAYPGSKSCVVKYSVDFQFNMNQQSYTFMGFEAKSYDDPSVSLDQYVTFTEIDYNDQTGIYKASLKVNENCSSILVNPVCKVLPAVTKYTPETLEAQSSNTPIVITFNMPMEEADAAQTLFTKDNISLIYTDSAGNNTDMRDYFEAPVFDSTKQILTIVPKIFADPAKKDIEQFILRDKKVPYADINVSFSENIVVKEVDRQGNKLALKQDSRSKFAVRYKADIEQVAPAKVDFFVSASEITFANAATFAAANKFTEDPLSDIEDNDEKILQNRTKGEIWIYGKYYDKDSGVKTVYVTEKRTNDVSGKEVSEQAQTTPYSVLNSNGASFKTDKDGNTEFVIPYSIKSDGGAVAISLAVEDGCYNHDDAQDDGVVVIKDCGVFEIAYQSEYKILDEMPLCNDSDIVKFTIETEELFGGEGMKRQKLYKKVYKNFRLAVTEENDIIHSYISYTDKDGEDTIANFTFSTGQGVWYYAMDYECEDPQYTDYSVLQAELSGLDLENSGGTEFTLVVTDDIGNINRKTYSIPQKPVPAAKESFTDKWGEEGYLVYFGQREADDTLHLIRIDSEGDAYDMVNLAIFPEAPYTMYSDYTYKAYFSRADSSTGASIRGPVCEVFDVNFSPTSLEQVDVTEITYANHPNSEDTDVIVHIAEDSWEKYDSIYFSVKDNEKTKKYFKQGEFTASFTEKTYFLYKQTYKLTIIGKKDSETTVPLELETTKLSGEEYDNCKPDIFYRDMRYSDLTWIFTNDYYFNPPFNRLDMYDRVYLGSVSDYGSGADYIKIKVGNGDTELTYTMDDWLIKRVPMNYYPYTGNTHWDCLFIPVWDMEDDRLGNMNGAQEYSDGYGNYFPFSVTNVSYTIFDKAGNSHEYTSNDGSYNINFKKVDKPTYTLTENASNVTCAPSAAGSVYVYALEKQGDEYVWNLLDSATTYSFSQKSIHKLIVEKKLTNDSNRTNDFGFSDPLYVCIGQGENLKASSGKYDYILPMSGTKKSVLVSSDATTFVHTLVTKRPYSECKDWDVEKWEHHRRHIGDYQMDFSETDHSPQKYKIPVTEMDSGDCYCVIAHFADGSTAMSEVMQNP